jgi:hypothetical protein
MNRHIADAPSVVTRAASEQLDAVNGPNLVTTSPFRRCESERRESAAMCDSAGMQ